MTPKVNNQEAARSVRADRYIDGRVTSDRPPLAVEAALEIVVNGISHSLLMQTPGWERELVVGYLYTEGLIDGPDEVADLKLSEGPAFLEISGLRAEATLPRLEVENGLPLRPALSLSSCGLCGKEDLEKLGRGLGRVKSKQKVAWKILEELINGLKSHQPLYEQTRGVHAVALFETDGRFVCCYEDVGRHNALDKSIGRALLEGWSLADKVAVLSGRASLEMVLKAARAGLPVLLCFSSPTVLAVEAAKVLNLTLVGRREDKYLMAFSHGRRLMD
jgi:FdhD protein